MRPHKQLEEVLGLLDAGKSDGEVAAQTGVPRRTICDWRRGRCLVRDRRRGADHKCRDEHDFSLLPEKPYAYLLGLYLGDGCISHGRRGVYCLRITLDSRYPRIISECSDALERIFPSKTARAAKRTQSRCVDVSMWSKHWPCLIPQHGRGVKHERRIRLTGWQTELVERHRPALLRGLIHSDGCRIIAREKSGSGLREAPRYLFSNRSEDIKELFCNSCDALGIRWTRPSDIQIAIYRKASVAVLDDFVGPKT